MNSSVMRKVHQVHAGSGALEQSGGTERPAAGLARSLAGQQAEPQQARAEQQNRRRNWDELDVDRTHVYRPEDVTVQVEQRREPECRGVRERLRCRRCRCRKWARNRGR